MGLCSLLVSLCGLRQPSPVVYRFYDRANIIGIPPRGIKPTDTSQDPCCQCPQQATANTYLLRRPSNSQRQVWSVSCGVTAPFRWVLVHTRYSLCPPPRVSVSLSPVEVLRSNSAVLQSQISTPQHTFTQDVLGHSNRDDKSSSHDYVTVLWVDGECRKTTKEISA